MLIVKLLNPSKFSHGGGLPEIPRTNSSFSSTRKLDSKYTLSTWKETILLKASKFAQLALEVRSSSYARYESVEVVTAILFKLVLSH